MDALTRIIQRRVRYDKRRRKKILTGILYDLGNMSVEYLSEKDGEKMREVIKTLEQEPCEDAISRQALLDTISELNAISFYEAQEDSKECYYEIRQAIKDLLPVKPQEKTGHWITTRTFMHDGEWYCDKCKCDSPNNKKWDYCPNCGARMEVDNGDK